MTAYVLQRKVREHFNRLCKKHNIKDWELSFDFAGQNTIALTDYEHKTVYVSKYYMEILDYKQLKNEVVHEVAHILAPEESRHHGPKWKETCKRIGHNGDAYYRGPSLGPKWLGQCVRCAQTFQYYKINKKKQCCDHIVWVERYSHKKHGHYVPYLRRSRKV